MTGSEGADTLKGDGGNDVLFGAKGGDTVSGGEGDDTMTWNPGDGSDVNNGEAGLDTVLSNGVNADEVYDYAPAAAGAPSSAAPPRRNSPSISKPRGWSSTAKAATTGSPPPLPASTRSRLRSTPVKATMP